MTTREQAEKLVEKLATDLTQRKEAFTQDGIKFRPASQKSRDDWFAVLDDHWFLVHPNGDGEVTLEYLVDDATFVADLQAKDIHVFDGGHKTVPGLPSIHDIEGLEHLGYGSFRDPNGRFDPRWSPRGHRFYAWWPEFEGLRPRFRQKTPNPKIEPPSVEEPTLPSIASLPEMGADITSSDLLILLQQGELEILCDTNAHADEGLWEGYSPNRDPIGNADMAAQVLAGSITDLVGAFCGLVAAIPDPTLRRRMAGELRLVLNSLAGTIAPTSN